MKGYIFIIDNEHYLTKTGYSWNRFSSIRDGYVHPENLPEELRARLEKPGEVEVRPDKVYPATYSKETGIVITGEAFDF